VRYRLLVFAVAMYPTINDRILRTKDYYCRFVPAENLHFVIVLSFLGHHIPCIVIVVCYIIVFIEIRKLFKSRPGARTAAAAIAQARAKAKRTTSIIETAYDDKTYHDKSAATALSDNNKEMDQQKEQKNCDQRQNPQQPQQQQQQQQQKRQAVGTLVSSDAQARDQRERKSFVTLSYMVIGYVVCWVPFHFVYDVSFIRPELVSEDLYTATFWLTYVNSLINPFLYAFSSADLRSAVVKILKCRCNSH